MSDNKLLGDLPYDVRGNITTYLDYNESYYPVDNPEQFITKHTATYKDTFETIKKFKNLKEFKCGCYNQFTDEHLKHLTKLEILHCSISDFSNDLFVYLPNLRELYCAFLKPQQLTDVGLSYLPNLEVLHCGYNLNFTDVGLSYLPKLKVLDCHCNANFTDVGLSYLPNLELLHCGSNKKFTDVGFSYLPKLEKIIPGFNKAANDIKK